MSDYGSSSRPYSKNVSDEGAQNLLNPSAGSDQGRNSVEFPQKDSHDDALILGIGMEQRESNLRESQRQTHTKAISFVNGSKFGVVDVDEADEDIQEALEG